MSITGDGPGLSKAKRRLGRYLAGAALLMLTYAFIYRWAVGQFVGGDVTFLGAMHHVVETFTTTGYGEQAAFLEDSPPLQILSILMQLTGVTTVFLTLPLFLVPLVEDALRTAPPTASDLTDHVVICTFTPRGDALVDELDSMGVPYVILESDRDLAEELHGQEYEVVHGDPESVESLEAANAPDALAIVADDDDETNASIILAAKQAAPDARVVSLIEDPRVMDYHHYAGADQVVSPRRLLGESLAGKATTSISSDLGDAIEIGEDFEVAELLVQRESPVEGKTIAESGIGRTTGVNVIGAWFSGEFVSPPAPNAVIDEHTILLVVGREKQLEELRGLTRSSARRFRRGTVIVAGYGEVGSTAAETLASAGVPHVIVDKEDKPGVDVVGDITDPQTLAAANVTEARGVLLALSSDTTAVFATLVSEHISEETEVIARANETGSIAKLYRAGADYVLALSTVAGRMLASTVLDEEVIAPQSQIEIVRTHAPNLVGQSLVEADVRARTNCTVIAVERDGTLVTEISPDFRVEEQDDLIVAGVDEDIYQFNEQFG
ncbi:TrkA family potassium uptake protein [Haloferax mediterranei ATCC 33500]|uniref:Kef-type potassium channel protein n=1 Tax=Haloferax mediterranei (strain ATCC 33500 / DSM 1411 / JCM 8866 / NBRC 14739 / NCIMB 2177 / R-4) TaxID=523841 RepID=I3R3Q5_HALMT|nr:NAD-binding protein [Haloferax mediterranei]AFK18865.1 Kef-type potassium channel protein [Haloferax mediterranei ATCC 33500]AHZ21772.1 metal transporter [Haloferax mediterranei ATCC 33500]EMA03277.1 Kef-type potassium channel protein [Haloferax mediterranei ATCC 33500]MDX5988958.1 NAD-binding protein [Haloferax mediterranei ATCC 33500]QCQ75351.1 TrkA family potassium uptake protein [Haloferax mediterranei ATCC 33500]